MTNEEYKAVIGYMLDMAWGIECTCCGEPARAQCKDHDTGYGVCDRCLAKYGRHEFCKSASCTAHDQPA